jgi:hypothetical protein
VAGAVVFRTLQFIYESNRTLGTLERFISAIEPVSFISLRNVTCDTDFLGSYSKWSYTSSTSCGTSVLSIAPNVYTDMFTRSLRFQSES